MSFFCLSKDELGFLFLTIKGHNYDLPKANSIPVPERSQQNPNKWFSTFKV